MVEAPKPLIEFIDRTKQKKSTHSEVGIYNSLERVKVMDKENCTADEQTSRDADMNPNCVSCDLNYKFKTKEDTSSLVS